MLQVADVEVLEAGVPPDHPALDRWSRHEQARAGAVSARGAPQEGAGAGPGPGPGAAFLGNTPADPGDRHPPPPPIVTGALQRPEELGDGICQVAQQLAVRGALAGVRVEAADVDVE